MSDRTYDENDDGAVEREKSYKYNQSELLDRLALPGRGAPPHETSNICGEFSFYEASPVGRFPGVVR